MIMSRRATGRTLIKGILLFLSMSLFLHPFPLSASSQISSVPGRSSWKAAVERRRQQWACRKWDPALPEYLDPPDCLRAKQYRQVRRVYEREEKKEHPRWYFTDAHNIETLREAQRCFLPESHVDHLTCPEKPIIVAGYWWTAALSFNGTSGEAIWMKSIVEELQNMNYFVTFQGPLENWARVWEMMPDAILFLWVGELDTVSCIGDPRCIMPAHYNPHGEDLSVGVPEDELGKVPINVIHTVDYWGSRPASISVNQHYWNMGEGEWSYSPLGQRWTATPWALPGHTYLPYSLEKNCPAETPWETRNESALLLAKKTAYFDLHWVPGRELLSALANETYFNLISTANEDEGHPMPYGLQSIGGKNREEYEQLVGSVKAMLGIGMPTISPSVYQALCQGVPVVLPQYEEYQELDGWGPFGGWSQHGPAALIGPPYVYSYDVQDYDSLNSTVFEAMRTPIKPYVPDDMRRTSVISHLEEYVTTDWDQLFLDVLASNGGRVPKQHPNILERCFELDRCSKIKEGEKKYRPPVLIPPIDQPAAAQKPL